MKPLKITDLASRSFEFFIKRPSLENILWLNFAVTYHCNSKCLMCSIWERYRQNPELAKNELSLKDIKDLLGSTYLKNLKGISFTGGEPFLRKDFPDIAGLFIEKYPGAIIGVATNGLNTKLVVEKVKDIEKRFDPGHLSISLSLDGLFEKHDEIRGVKGAFKLVNETIDALKSGTGVNIGIDFTITPWNYKELLKVYRFTKEKDIIFLAGFAHHSEAYYGNTELKFEFDDNALEEIENAMKDIVSDRIENESLLRKFSDPYVLYLSRCVEFHKSKDMHQRCYSGIHSLFLDPYGNVYPCIISGKKIGNIKDGFDKIWTSQEAEEIRYGIKCGECSCWVACETVTSMLRSPNFVKWNIMNKFW